ncbi:hypothetical protein [Lysobacter gummosus]|uniref:hypothetical protein n=1 Tax=Lysobacter gummosus TaxID=262324 RepID=UPI0036359F3D
MPNSSGRVPGTNNLLRMEPPRRIANRHGPGVCVKQTVAIAQGWHVQTIGFVLIGAGEFGISARAVAEIQARAFAPAALIPSPQPSPAPRRKSPWVASGRGRGAVARGAVCCAEEPTAAPRPRSLRGRELQPRPRSRAGPTHLITHPSPALDRATPKTARFRQIPGPPGPRREQNPPSARHGR